MWQLSCCGDWTCVQIPTIPSPPALWIHPMCGNEDPDTTVLVMRPRKLKDCCIRICRYVINDWFDTIQITNLKWTGILIKCKLDYHSPLKSVSNMFMAYVKKTKYTPHTCAVMSQPSSRQIITEEPWTSNRSTTAPANCIMFWSCWSHSELSINLYTTTFGHGLHTLWSVSLCGKLWKMSRILKINMNEWTLIWGLSKILTAVSLKTAVFWDVMLSSLLDGST